jgi:hypothetical protein
MDTNTDREKHPPVEPSSPGSRYVIQVQGHMDLHWSEWLQGMTMTHAADGRTRLDGTLIDQAALHGVLSKLRDLCVPIVSVECVGAADTSVPCSPGSPESASWTRPKDEALACEVEHHH